MTGPDVEKARQALADLPEGTSHGEAPTPAHVYLPRSHVRAIDPNNPLVTGMRGAGKTFWWSALQEPDVRRWIASRDRRSKLNENTGVRTGFGVTPAPDEYPSKDALRNLMRGVEPRIVWRTVQAWQLAPGDHPLRKEDSWAKRTHYVDSRPEPVDRLFQQRDDEFDRKGIYSLILFDALDRCADDWRNMYRAIRGLLQTALEMRSYKRLRVKVFLRSDQVNETEIADFPDASKILASAVELSWPRSELYGLLWHNLANGKNGEIFRAFLRDDDSALKNLDSQPRLFDVPRRSIFSEEFQREKFHVISGPWMGKDRRRGLPYTWVPNHLADTEGRVSPRSFLAALRTAAEETASNRSEHKYALHYDSIKRGVQEASKIRVSELREDYPWVDRAMRPLEGMVVPCVFREIEDRWQSNGVLERLAKEMEKKAVKLPPRRIEQGTEGVREDLEFLGVFMRMRDERVNIPDVFRVGYGLGRRGGVRPVR